MLSLAVVIATLLLYSPLALAEVKMGTDNGETIAGTNSSDHLTGKGGNDALKGLAGNDVYHFADGFGKDELEERASYKVGRKTLPGGTDTLSFARHTFGVTARLVPGWVAQDHNKVFAGPDNGVDLGASRVENVVGSLGDDTLVGGAGKNTYSGGPGGSDLIHDRGGWEGDSTFPVQAASDDTYKGFASSLGTDTVVDWGGAADRLDLRPLEASDVYLDAFDHDGSGADDSLRILTNSTSSVSVIGHFAAIPGLQLKNGSGRIEQIVFADETVTTTAELKALLRASSGEWGVAPASREFLETPFPELLPAEAR